jgi:hypothetical protein
MSSIGRSCLIGDALKMAMEGADNGVSSELSPTEDDKTLHRSR